MRICIVTSDFVGPIRNGGIGTAYYGMARTLAEAGHEVTVLYVLGEYCENHNISHWKKHYHKLGINLVPLPQFEGMIFDGPWCQQIAFMVYEWLKRQTFDVVHFHEWRGHGYHVLLAKQQGLAFENTILCVGVHSPYLWHKMADNCFIDSLEDLEIDFLERQSVALADVVISPSMYLLEWMKKQGWDIPESSIVRQNILPGAPEILMREAHKIKEIVFFGRLEARKGLLLFCDALDRIAKESVLESLKVTFLGKSSTVAGRDSISFLKERASAWSFAWSVIQNYNHKQAIDYLKKPGRLAVIPSLIENSPFTVLECLGHAVPFVASNTGGIPELIAAEDHERVLFHPNARSLGSKLLEVIDREFPPAKHAISPQEVRQEWIAWHNSLKQSVQKNSRVLSSPLVSICLVHHNRPQYLQQAIKSLLSQDYSPMEVVLVDDGSMDPEALAFLDELEIQFEARDWRLVRQENRYLGAARNTAAQYARGNYLLFMDDDNIAKPHMVSTFVKAAQVSGADILTSFMDVFEGDIPSDSTRVRRWLPLGGAGGVGLFRNSFGDANSLVKKEVFTALGGFTEEYGLGHEDWEFYAKAVLKGFRLQVIPEALFWYRSSQQGMLHTTSFVENHMRSLRPYLDHFQGDLKGIILLAQGLFFKVQNTGVPMPNEALPPPEICVQTLVDNYWYSTSWKMTRPLRNLSRYLRGLPKEEKPKAQNVAEALQIVDAIQHSIYWEITGPFRALRRMTKLRRTGPRL